MDTKGERERDIGRGREKEDKQQISVDFDIFYLLERENKRFSRKDKKGETKNQKKMKNVIKLDFSKSREKGRN